MFQHSYQQYHQPNDKGLVAVSQQQQQQASSNGAGSPSLFGDQPLFSPPIHQHTYQQAITNQQMSPAVYTSELPVPDLIPDSPSSFSPPNSMAIPPQSSNYNYNSSHAAALQATPFGTSPPLPQYALNSLGWRAERSSSVPVQTFPKPIRRRTQEWKDQETFVPTFYGSGSSTNGTTSRSSTSGSSSSLNSIPGQTNANTLLSNYLGNQQSAFGMGSAQSSQQQQQQQQQQAAALGALWAPSTDHPLSMPEQQDLLDRVRRDLNGVDLDNIKGPLRALALGSQQQQQAMLPPAAPGSNNSGMFSQPAYNVAPGGPGQQQHNAYFQQQQQQQLQHTQALAQAAAQIRASRDAMMKAQRDRERDDMMRKTVSPQEAFLDYDDVDHRLHSAAQSHGRSSSLSSLPFGVGGAASLFAPLPRPSSASSPTSAAAAVMNHSHHATSQPQRTPRTPPPIGTVHPHSSALPSRASSPGVAANSTTSAPGSIGSLSPRSAHANLPHSSAEGHSRRPHPFAVPQNAVSWAEGRTASFNEEDTRGSSDDDQASASGMSSSRASLLGGPVHQASPEPEDKFGAVNGRAEGDTRASTTTTAAASTASSMQFAPAKSRRAGTPSRRALEAAAADVTSGASPSAGFAPARQSKSGSPAAATTGSRDGTPATGHHAMRPSAMRALNALQHDGDEDDDEDEDGGDGEQDADGEDDVGSYDGDGGVGSVGSVRAGAVHDALESDDDDEFVPRASTSAAAAAAPALAKAKKVQRKRSRTPAPEEGGSSEEDDGSFCDDDGDSDGGGRGGSKASRRRASGGARAPNAAPNKRRRRQPNAASTTATSSSQIKCPHVNDDGTTCGVVFRRPYDLARHRETIHGEGKKVKDWICKACNGSFSRKDALIRHARIRGHNAGL